MSTASPSQVRAGRTPVVSRYLSLIKFSHTVFALPFALIGFVLGVLWRFESSSEHTTWTIVGWLLLKVVLCMVFARSAAMAFNRWLDRRFDALNPRTAVREIPAGAISPAAALAFTAAAGAAFVATAYFINSTCFLLSPVALFVILFYSYTKRITPLCHLVLGVGLALAPVGAFLAVNGDLNDVAGDVALIFSFVVLTWVAGFDIIYALQDEDFDRTQGLKSIPAALGKKRALRLSEALHIATAGLIVFAGSYGGFHPLYWAGAAGFIALLIRQHVIVKPHDLSRVNAAFGTTNGLASVELALFTIAALLLQHL